MYLSAEATSDWSWPEVVLILGLLTLAIFTLGFLFAGWLENRKVKTAANQENDLRQLVHRYEQLAENTHDAQQRIATDVAELRTRTAAIEQILRTVE